MFKDALKSISPKGEKQLNTFLPTSRRGLAFSHPVGDRALALKVEYHFKRLSKKEKERVVDSQQLVFDRDSGKIRVAE